MNRGVLRTSVSMVLFLSMLLLLVVPATGKSSTMQTSPPERPYAEDGPQHTNQLVLLDQGLKTAATVKILINTSGSGPLTGISPVAEKTYWYNLLSTNPNYSVSWYDGIPSSSLLAGYDMVIYDAGGYWYPFIGYTQNSGLMSALSSFHNSGKPMIVVAPDINYDWIHVDASTLPGFIPQTLHIGGVRGLMYSSDFWIYANTGHEMIQSLGTNVQIPILSNSSWPDSFSPINGATGVIRQGTATVEFDRGTVASNPTAYTFGPSGNLYSVVAYPGSTGDGRVVTFGFPPTAIQNSSQLDQLAMSAINYALKKSNVVKPVTLDNVYVDDAVSHALVHKVGGDFLDAVAQVTNGQFTSQVVNVDFSAPSSWTVKECSWRLDSSGTGGQSITCTSNGAGKYRLTGTFTGTRQFVIRYSIPSGAPGLSAVIQADISLPDGVPQKSSQVAYASIDTSARAIIVTNRALLYRTYARNEVDSFLNYLTDVAMGDGSGELQSVIYYADFYPGGLANWDNTQVTYPDPPNAATTNTSATVLDNLIDGWVTRNASEYILLVGGDNILPMFRVEDPLNEEASAMGSRSNYQGNDPMLTAIRHDYIPSDAPYADTQKDDYLYGEVEVSIGRIAGATLADMRQLIANGLQGPTGISEGTFASAVGASIKQASDRFATQGVTSNATLINNDNWTEQNLIDDLNGGAVTFGQIMHNEYDYIVAADSNHFTTQDIAGLNTTIENNLPFIGYGGCHGGLPANLAGQAEPADNNVYAWVHKDASAFYGSSALVGYDSAYDDTAYGEQLFNEFFLELVHDATTTRSIGEAQRLANRNYDAGWIWEDSDKKAVIEFNLFGVPWMTPDYKTTTLAADPGAVKTGPKAGFTAQIGDPKQVDASFSRAVGFTVPSYSIVQDGGYDLVQITGAKELHENQVPVVPYLSSAVINLPLDAVITNVSLVGQTTASLGALHLPNFQVSTTENPLPPFTDVTGVTGNFPVPNFTYGLTAYPDHQELVIKFFPVTHNPQTRQTTLSTSATIQVTYTSQYELVMVDSYASADEIQGNQLVQATVVAANAGASTLTSVTASLVILDSHGVVVSTTVSSPFTISPGATQPIPLTASTVLPGGTYRLVYQLRDGLSNLVGTNQGYVKVISGLITSFTSPAAIWQPPSGMDIPFIIKFTNYLPTSTTAAGKVVIYSGGDEVATLLGTPITVLSGETVEIVLNWNSLGKEYTQYEAAGSVTTSGDSFGPSVHSFTLDGPTTYLPAIIR